MALPLDPERFPGLARRQVERVEQYAKQANAAEGARYGSLAHTNDPNRYGSLASTQFPQLFGPGVKRRERAAGLPPPTQTAAAPARRYAPPPPPGVGTFDPMDVPAVGLPRRRGPMTDFEALGEE